MDATNRARRDDAESQFSLFVVFSKGLSPMKLSTCSLALFALVLTAGISNADVVFTGATNSNEAFLDSNYDFSGSSLSAIDPNVAIMDNVTMTNKTLDATDFPGGFAGYIIGDGYSLTLNSSTFISNGSGGIKGVPGSSVSDFYLNDSTMNMQFATDGASIHVDGTSSLILRGGGDPINSQGDRTVVNLAPGATLTLATVAEFTEQGDDILVNGVSFTDDNSILTFNGTTATAVAAVPEPSSVALLGGLALFGFGLKRRRK